MSEPVQEHPNDTPFREPRVTLSPAAQKLDDHLAASIAELAPQRPPQEKPMSITGIGGAGSTIKQLLEDHKSQMTNLIEGHVAELKENLTQQRAAVGAFGRMVASAKKETEDFLADLGQFTNDLGI